MNTTLFIIAIVFIVLATYANMKGSHKLGFVLSGIAGGFAMVVLFEDWINPFMAFMAGFVLTVVFERIRLALVRR